MPKKRLTEEGVARLKPPPKGKQVDYYDAVMPGLTLRVNFGGRKVWRVLTYVKTTAKSGKRQGQPITMPVHRPLGRYPTMQLKAAREAARAFLADPSQAARDQSFEAVAASFFKRHVEAKGLRTRHEMQRVLNRYILPRWQHRPFESVTRTDVTALLDHVEEDHGASQADVVLMLTRAMMNFHATRSNDYVSPIVRNMKRGNGHKRDRILSDDEIKALWTVTGDMVGCYGALLRTLLLTGQRRAKVEGMTWSDLVDGTWVIQTEVREKGNAQTLRLPQMVLDLLEQQPRIRGDSRVFAVPGSPHKAKLTLDRRMKALLGEMEPFVIHDLRRTARSLMARAGVQPHIAERVLGHAVPGVAGIYDRHSYELEKAEALQRLADLVGSIVESTPVVRTAVVT
jgi:integrase